MRILRPFIRITVPFVLRSEEVIIFTNTHVKGAKALTRANRGSSLQKAVEYAAFRGWVAEVREIVYRSDVNRCAILHAAAIGGQADACHLLAKSLLARELIDAVLIAYFSNNVDAALAIRHWWTVPQLFIPRYEKSRQGTFQGFTPPYLIHSNMLMWSDGTSVRCSGETTIHKLYNSWREHWINEELIVATLKRNYEEIKNLIRDGASALEIPLSHAIAVRDYNAIKIILRYYFAYAEPSRKLCGEPLTIKSFIREKIQPTQPSFTVLGITVPKWVIRWIAG